MELDMIPYSIGSVCEYKNNNSSSGGSSNTNLSSSSSKSNLYGSSNSSASSEIKYSISTPSTPMSHSYNVTFNITPPNQPLITSSPIINSQSNLLNTSTNSTNNNSNNNLNNNNNNNNSSYLTVSSFDLPETLSLNKCYKYCNTNFNNGKPDNYNPLKHLYEPPSPIQPAQLSLSQSSQPLPQQPTAPPPQILINNSSSDNTPTPIIMTAEEQQQQQLNNSGVIVGNNEQSSNSTNFDLDNPTQRKRSTSFSMKNLNILSHQVAGQAPLLKLPNGKILKPLVPQEYHFYESIQYHSEFVGYTPKFYGVLDLKNYDFRYLEETFKSQHNSHSIDYNHWRNKTINLPKDWQNLYIKIEDLTYLCKYPCILDLKMGTRQHGVDAPIDKVNKMQQKCKLTTSSSLGFRVCGLKVYDQKQGTYSTYDKFYGRNLKDTDIPAVICKFVDNGLRHRTEILSGIAKRLYQLISLFETQTCFKFYGGSLLLIYDQSTSLQDAKINIKMVDFAHASPNHTHHPNNNGNNNSNNNGLDEGYLFGLKNLLKIVNNLVQISNVNIGETCYF